VVFFSPLFVFVPFVIQLNFSCLVFFSVAYDTHIIGFASVVYQIFHHFFLVKFGRPCNLAPQVCYLVSFGVVFKVFAFIRFLYPC